ncbi:excalibur calcium-binding domain-containing protein [Nocardia sp. NBC_01503]|uniref:excalibur calcium-binding domain-containing protein n=1 Tax=Nocardia sp. NBC_01503 TaxID=2975997 RepID=UPI002E7AF34F|nr:excalibur calcium-binding domain-containing protein [Nocardia sp. NBC_01503]
MKHRSDFRLRASVVACLGAIACTAILPAVASAEPRINNTPPPSTTQSAPYPYYVNCEQVRARGKAPLLAGQPGYTRQLDPDGNGVACGY